MQVKLAWKRCPDGVSLFDAGISAEHPQDDAAVERVGEIFKARSTRREGVSFELTDLEKPIAVKFVNAKTDKQRLEFLQSFGFLGTKVERKNDWLPRETFEDAQGDILKLLEDATSGDPEKTVPAIHSALGGGAQDATTGEIRPPHDGSSRIWLGVDYDTPDQSLRLVHVTNTLLNYMVLECVEAGIRQTKLTTCAHCGQYFLTGHTTKRRADAVYCKDLCRVNAMRKRKASEGASNVDPQA